MKEKVCGQKSTGKEGRTETGSSIFFLEMRETDKSGFREKNRDTPLPSGMMIGRLECWEQESWGIRVSR